MDVSAPITLAYGSEPDQVVDLFLPRDVDGAALVVLLHGGFWRARVDRHYLEPAAQDLAGRGYAVANVEYRRVGAGGGWPATLLDIAAAADALPGLVARAAPGVDLRRTVHVGHSAGGHLALWAAMRDRLPHDAPGASAAVPAVAGVVALAPACCLADGYARGIGEGAVSGFLGGGPGEFPQRYAAADPAALGAPPVPTVVVHGDRDDRVPVDMARTYCAATGAQLLELAGVGHMELTDPAASVWPSVVDLIGRSAAR